MIKALRSWLQGQARVRDASPSQNANQGQGQSPGADTFQDAANGQPANTATTYRPQTLAVEALEGLKKAWIEQANTHRPPISFLSAEVVAQLFASSLRGELALFRHGINSTWIREHYPLFCNSLHLYFPPPYKDFAHELAKVLPRRRRENWENGKRIRSFTCYYV
jgi:hypothetical protein